MAIRATHVSTGTDIVIGPLIDSTSQAVIDEIYQNCAAGVLECREHDFDPYLAHLRDPSDGRVHGAWVHLKKNPARTKWIIAHSASGIGREFRSHEVPVGKSAQHQWQQDYISRAAEDAGFAVDQEVTLPTGTRLDVQVEGTVGIVGFEVQHSFLSVPKVRNRTRKAASEGIPLVWSADRKNPDWAFKVPHIEANQLPHGFTERGSWTITTGPRRIVSILCSPQNADLIPMCQKPARHRNYCGTHHPMFEPIRGLRVDDIAQQVPAGELIPLDTNTKQGIVLVAPADVELWHDEFATQFQSNFERKRNDARRCGYRPTLQQNCAGCGQRLMLIQTGRVLCERCCLDSREEPHGMTSTIRESSADTWRWLAPGYDH
jgi:hypothetical protein